MSTDCMCQTVGISIELVVGETVRRCFQRNSVRAMVHNLFESLMNERRRLVEFYRGASAGQTPVPNRLLSGGRIVWWVKQGRHRRLNLTTYTVHSNFLFVHRMVAEPFFL